MRLEGRSATDVDILAFKDGIVFVVQAKYLADRLSLRRWWRSYS